MTSNAWDRSVFNAKAIVDSLDIELNGTKTEAVDVKVLQDVARALRAWLVTLHGEQTLDLLKETAAELVIMSSDLLHKLERNTVKNMDDARTVAKDILNKLDEFV